MAAARFRRLVLSIGLVSLLAGASGWATPVAASGSYLLPLDGGTHVLVTQGNGGGHTGWEKYAWDFAVFGRGAEFPIVAARGGTVIGLQAGHSQHCLDSSCWTLANYILLDQGDGTAGLYMHLALNSVKVVLGQQVAQGQSLGDADNTGWSTGNHLHFQVEQTPSQKVLDQANAGQAAAGWWFTQSVSVSFSDSSVLARNPDGMPTYSGSFPGGYVSSNGGSQAAITPSPMPTPAPSRRPTPTPAPTPTPIVVAAPTPAQSPLIISVSGISPMATQTIRIEGSGFGQHAPYTGCTSFIELADLTGAWNAGWQEPGSPYSDNITLMIVSWTDSEIVVGGLAGDYGAVFDAGGSHYDWNLKSGDQVRIRIWNAQTSSGPAVFLRTVS